MLQSVLIDRIFKAVAACNGFYNIDPVPRHSQTLNNPCMLRHTKTKEYRCFSCKANGINAGKRNILLILVKGGTLEDIARRFEQDPLKTCNYPTVRLVNRKRPLRELINV